MKKWTLIIAAGLAFTSCLKDKTVEPVDMSGPCSETVFFQDEIQTEITNLSCNVAGCHDSSSGAGGYVFETHEQISTNADIILNAIRQDGSAASMPLGGDKLADSLIQKFDCWITQGKLDN